MGESRREGVVRVTSSPPLEELLQTEVSAYYGRGMPTHDVLVFAHSLSSKLATRSRHVCLFAGAGASKACGLPDVATLEQLVVDGLQGDEGEVLAQQLKHRDLEQVLSRLRRIAALVEGDDQVEGLSGEAAAGLDSRICRLIVENLSLESANLEPMLRLAGWAARTDYAYPLELFTVNYDLLIEAALERLAVPYFDGFVGGMKGRFRTDLVEAGPDDPDVWLPRFVTRLWKLHGSVNWAWDAEGRGEVVRLGSPVDGGSPVAIYPSDAKYEESRRVPFVVLQDRLRRALHQPETLMIVSGYAWADEHLNEVMFDAATRRPRSEIIALCYSDIPDVLVERADSTPNIQVVTGTEAVIGGVRGAWRPPEDEEDVPAQLWNDGKMALRDFEHLASFLARSSRHEESVAGPDELLARVTKTDA